jgi:hypothetical protein
MATVGSTIERQTGHDGGDYIPPNLTLIADGDRDDWVENGIRQAEREANSNHLRIVELSRGLRIFDAEASDPLRSMAAVHTGRLTLQRAMPMFNKPIPAIAN